MKKPPHPPDKRRRHLSKEDEALWETTAGTIKPLKRAKPRIHHAPGAADRGVPASNQPGRPASIALEVAPAVRAAAKASDIPALKPPPLSLFDRKAARRLRGGQFEIEARVDLHGLTQSAAHAALHRFLASCHTGGLRWVLVITGKGLPRRRGAEANDSEWSTRGERGVLKRNVPVWLAEPELRAIVVSYTTAAIQHGGEGALYVQLRSPNRGRTRD